MIADPFHERISCRLRTRVRVLGGIFDFESNSRTLLRLVDIAFAGLPTHAFESKPPTFRIRLLLSPAASAPVNDEPPRMKLHGGAGLLCGTMDAANFAVVASAERTGLVVISRSMLLYPYHIRYELIEFVVYTLASRVQKLISLHAACIGRNGRGLLLIGASGGGKSTLALHCALRGLDLVAEDGILVMPDTLRATGIGSFLHLREDSLRFAEPTTAAPIRRSPVIRRRSGVEKFEVDLRRTRHPIAAEPLQIAGVVVLSSKKATTRSGPDALLKPLGKTELRRQLNTSQPYAAGQPGWTTFAGRIASVPGFELQRGRHPDEGVDALLSLL